jgi:sulfite reductase beta subunit-like hemoprotein
VYVGSKKRSGSNDRIKLPLVKKQLVVRITKVSDDIQQRLHITTRQDIQIHYEFR